MEARLSQTINQRTVASSAFQRLKSRQIVEIAVTLNKTSCDMNCAFYIRQKKTTLPFTYNNLDVFFSELESILPLIGVLSDFSVALSDTFSDDEMNRYTQRIKESILSKFRPETRKPLPVNVLSYHSRVELLSGVVPITECLKSEALDTLNLSTESINDANIDFVTSLPGWKELKSVDISACSDSLKVKDFRHLKEAKIVKVSLSLDELKSLNEEFLTLQNEKTFTIKYTNFEDEHLDRRMEELDSIFGRNRESRKLGDTTVITRWVYPRNQHNKVEVSVEYRYLGDDERKFTFMASSFDDQ